MYRILLVEDDPGIAQAVCAHLRQWELDARCVQNFRAVMEEFTAFDPQLVLLDISLPFFNGYHWCTQIRAVSQVPVVFLSSASENMNIVMAMNMGADDFIAKPKDLAGLHIAVTAGPTQEPLAPVRYLPTHSTGKMGYAVARAAAMRGAAVTLIHGPTALQPVRFTEDVTITTAQQMYAAVTSRFDEMDVLVMAAAVADYRPAAVADDKIKKKDGDLSIAVERTPDILGTSGPKMKGQFLCGFSMETRDMLANSSAKLEKKNLDMVVANNLKVAGAGFGVDTNVVTFITPDGARELPLMSKDDVADAILDEILARKSK